MNTATIEPAAVPDRFLTLGEVSQRIGFKTTWIYDRMKKRQFPLAHKVGGGSSRWSEHEVNAWIEQQKQAVAA